MIIKIIQGTSVTYYVNGELKETLDWVGNNSVSSNSTFNIGGHSGANSQSYDGLIDEVKIYNYALTSDEIAQDYNQSSRLVLGSGSTKSDGSTPSNSSDRSYCVPGDTTTCNPPVFEMTFDQQKVSGTGQTLYDTSGNGNNGTTSSANGTGMNCTIAGKIGNACEFDGVDDYITLSNSINESIITVSMWIKPENPDEYYSALFQNLDYSNDLGYSLMFGGTALSDIRFYVGGESIQETSSGITAGNWYNVSASWDGTIARLYVNGKEIKNGNLGTPAGYDGGIETIGRYASNYEYNGIIDQVRIYDYARTPAQIAWEYNRGAPVAWYKFDECQGTTIYDWSENANGGSNGNHGTLNIGATGTQTSAGTCDSGTSSQAWNNGTTGKWGSAMSFDGTDDIATVPLNIYGYSQITYSAWVKINGQPSSTQYSVITGNYGRSGLYINTNGKARARAFDTSDHYVDSATSVTNNQWHHIVATYDQNSTLTKIYIDGNYENQMSFYPSLLNHSTSYFVENPNTAADTYFTGQMDDVRIYNYALTPAQVKLIYNDGAVNFR